MNWMSSLQAQLRAAGSEGRMALGPGDRLVAGRKILSAGTASWRMSPGCWAGQCNCHAKASLKKKIAETKYSRN